MMSKILIWSSKNRVFGIIIKICCWVLLKFISMENELASTMRGIGISQKKYKKIKKLENQYQGKRCFIICTGPSLKIEDLELLSDEYTFGMNSINLLYEKTLFRPTFYGCIDKGVFNKLESLIEKFDSSNTLVFGSQRTLRGKNLKEHWYEVPCNIAYHTYDRWFKNNFWCKFSKDAYKGIYDMFSVTHFLIQIAVYMGFKEIYLLGADCDFPKHKQIHFQDYGVPDSAIDTARERNIAGYEEIKKQMEMYDFKVYNATRGGKLEVFERVDLDTLFEE